MNKKEKIVFETLDKEVARLEKENLIQDMMIRNMAERIEWLCKSNSILLDKEHGEDFNIDDIIEYFKKTVKIRSNNDNRDK